MDQDRNVSMTGKTVSKNWDDPMRVFLQVLGNEPRATWSEPFFRLA
jgi:hypothetical protein